MPSSDPSSSCGCSWYLVSCRNRGRGEGGVMLWCVLQMHIQMHAASEQTYDGFVALEVLVHIPAPALHNSADQLLHFCCLFHVDAYGGGCLVCELSLCLR